MTGTRGENVGETDVRKNVEWEIIVQKKEGATTYKMEGQRGDRPYGDGVQRLGRDSRWQGGGGEETCEGSQSPPRAAVLLLLLLMMMMMRYTAKGQRVCYSDSLQLERIGAQTPLGAINSIFFTSVQTVPGVHRAFCVPVLFAEGKAARAWP
jgi:hypothetical protein